MIARLFLLPVVCLLAACANQNLYPNARDPIDASQVSTFKEKPSFPYELIGRIKSPALDTFNRKTIVSSAIQGLKEKAAKLGANGVILDDTDIFLAAYMRTSTGTYLFNGSSGIDSFGDNHADGFPPVALYGEAIYFKK